MYYLEILRFPRGFGLVSATSSAMALCHNPASHMQRTVRLFFNASGRLNYYHVVFRCAYIFEEATAGRHKFVCSKKERAVCIPPMK